MRKRGLLLCLAVALCAAKGYGQGRRAYEGVVGLKRKTIGTVILLEATGDSLRGWMRLQKFVPIEGGTVSEGGAEFRAAGNHYQIDERRGRIAYSGPDGEGERYLQRLIRVSGRLEELVDASRFSGGQTAKVEVKGRPWELRMGRPALWKREGTPFETFPRMEEFLGREISFWLADADDRSGRVVAVEEPEGMDIPLKPPKKPKEKVEKQGK